MHSFKYVEQDQCDRSVNVTRLRSPANVDINAVLEARAVNRVREVIPGLVDTRHVGRAAPVALVQPSVRPTAATVYQAQVPVQQSRATGAQAIHHVGPRLFASLDMVTWAHVHRVTARHCAVAPM